MPERYEARREKLLRAVRKENVDALLVSGETNVTWLTGFTGDSSWLLLGPDVCVLISDGRYETQIEEECPGLEAVIRKPDVKLHDAVGTTIQRARLRRLGFESHLLTFDAVEQLTKAVPECELQAMPGKVEELRAVKDADEIAEIRHAVELAARGFRFLRASLTREMSELQIAHELEHALRRFGAEGTSFETIVAADDRSALAHYRPGRKPIDGCSWLLVDWGAETESRYKSDLTRLLSFGKPTKKLAKIYDIVLEAQRRAIDAIRPGVTGEAVDRVARDHIKSGGYGRNFGHGLGHGIGLEIHEMPRLAPNSQTVLEAGMVVTVEPGIYLPGWGGVRIEDDVLVTPGGHEVLSASVPKEFVSILVD